MRLLFTAALLALAAPQMASAATWIASCNDGQKVQYNQIVGSHGDLYFRTASGTYQVANTAQDSISADVICGNVTDNVPPGGPPITQVCADKAKQVIFLKYKNPTSPGSPVVNAGIFCKANVSVH